jgi:hypothetical protein
VGAARRAGALARGSVAWRSSGMGSRRGLGMGQHCTGAAFPATVRAMSDEPAAQAHALLERLFALLHDCRAPPPSSRWRDARADPHGLHADEQTLEEVMSCGA